MWVKICANTNLEDARLAANLGADALGFIFAPSPRQVTAAQAAAIVVQLPSHIEKVGVFPTWPPDDIVHAVEEAGLTAIQLHGTPNTELVKTIYTHFAGAVTIIQVVHWELDSQMDQPQELTTQLVQMAAIPEITRVLIDSKKGSTLGGTGAIFPWVQAKELMAFHSQTILAGGLNPDNLGEAISQLKPWGVDVASGVEAYPGKKDPAKLKAFLATARQACTLQL